MEAYNLLGEDSRRKYDTLVLSLMMRGKSLLQAVKMAEFSFRNIFKYGAKVKVAECYLNDEVNENSETNEFATVLNAPTHKEQLVMIQYYESGLIDYVPQDVLKLV